MNKILSLIVCVCLLAGLFPAIVSAGTQTYTLSSASQSGDWTLTQFLLQTSGGSGHLKANANTGNRGAVKAVLNSQIWKGNYTISGKVLNDWGGDANRVNLMFNYRDDSNFYYVIIPGGTSPVVKLVKRVGGTETTLATANALATRFNYGLPFSITYNNGAISVSISGTQIISANDTTLTSGKMGVEALSYQTYSADGCLYNLSITGEGYKATGPLVVEGCSMANGTTGVALDQQISFTFDAPLEPAFVTTGNVTVTANGKTVAPAKYHVAISPTDDQSMVLKFLDPMETKTDYVITVGTGVKSSVTTRTPLAAPYVVTYRTVAPAFDVDTYIIEDAGGNDVSADLLNQSGKNLSMRLVLKNNGIPTAQPYFAVATIENQDGKVIHAYTASGSLAMGQGDTYVVPFTMPTNKLQADYELKTYLFESVDTLKPLGSQAVSDHLSGTDMVTSAVVDDAAETVVIDGALNSMRPGRSITLLVLNPGKTIADLQTAGAIQKIATFKTEEAGMFSRQVSVGFNDDAIKGGQFTIYLGGDDFDTLQKQDVTFSLYSILARTNALAQIATATAETMKTALENGAEALGLNTPLWSSISIGDLASRMVAIVGNNQTLFTYQKEKEAIKRITQEAMVQVWNESEGDLTTMYGDDTMLNFMQVFQMTNPQATIAELYQNLSTVGKRNLQANLNGRSAASVTAFQKMFKQEVLASAVSGYSKTGYGHIVTMIDKNATEVALQAPLYNTLTEAEKFSVANQLFNDTQVKTFAKLQEKIEPYAQGALDARRSEPTPPRGGGGVTSTSKGNPESSPAPTMAPKPAEEYQLTDMQDSQWAIPYVMDLIEHQVIFEPADGVFRPNDLITRAEFTKMIMVASQRMGTTTTTGFVDCPPEHWAANYVASAKAAGFVRGISETEFGVDMKISRQDVAVIMRRVLGDRANRVDPVTGEPIPNIQIQFTDADQIADYAYDSVMNMVAGGVINGLEDGRFAPEDNCTRAQAAKLVCAILNR